MWKNYINNIELFSKNKTTKGYCIDFIAYLSQIGIKVNLLTLKELKDTFKNEEENDLFPIKKTLSKSFNIGQMEIIISTVYHLLSFVDDIFLFQFDSDLSEEKIYQKAFRESNIDNLFKNIPFNPDILLKDDEENRTLSFLFLYFLPSIEPNSLIMHWQKKVPLCVCPSLTKNHFEMMIFLMQKYEEQEFKLFCSEYHLNYILINLFFEEYNELYEFSDSPPKWEDILPIEKIKQLIDLNCSFDQLHKYKNKSTFYLITSIDKFLENLESTYKIEKRYNSLNQKVPISDTSFYRNEQIKKI